jgi:hypothetical protein
MRRLRLPALLSGTAALVVLCASAATGSDSPRNAKIEAVAVPSSLVQAKIGAAASLSGAVQFRNAAPTGTNITECPQAGMNTEPEPLSLIERDQVWRLSERGDDTRANTEFSCLPQNETTIAVNPTDPKNVIGAQNDYRLGGSFSGVNATTDGGHHWYDTLHVVPSVQNGDMLDSSGDPALAFDREGTAYLASIVFDRTDDTNGIWVNRSTDGGFSWSRPCVPIGATDETAVCGGIGDARQPGDGTVIFQPENEPTPPYPGNTRNFSVTFNDKEYIAAGPRPAGVQPTCFRPISRTPIPVGSPGCPESIIGPDRVYVTWTSFNNPTGVPNAIVSSTIEVSYSDDRGRSWSAKRTINGMAPFCTGATAGEGHCDDNQYSVPTVSPRTGHIYVTFENFDTPDENQWLVVRSQDGGTTWQGPWFVTSIFDVNFRARADCTARGGGSSLTNSCFRIPQTGAIVVDRRGGAFADDLYLIMSDNRNGTRNSTNTDVFMFKSTSGGSSWVGPTRVNDDRSEQPPNRNCGRGGQPPCPAGTPDFGNDNWWPWIDIGDQGDVNVEMKDRRLDTDSVAHEWPTSRQRPGNYLIWTWAAQCRVRESTMTPGRACVAPTAEIMPQPTEPVDPGNELFPEQTVFPFRNFQVSDVPSNYDYCFRAGLFCGDYESIAVSHSRGGGDRARHHGGSGRAWILFTDARNGRSSGGPAGGTQIPSQPGRNPVCEQSDVFVDSFNARNGGSGGRARNIQPFLITPCPGAEDD